MKKQYIAKASITIDAPISQVWKALTDPEIIKTYMFDSDVETDWKEGSPITWSGEWEGKKYEDKGTIIRIDKEHMLKYTHQGHTVTTWLSPEGSSETLVSLTQDGSATDKERQKSENNWMMILEGLKETVEK